MTTEPKMAFTPDEVSDLTGLSLNTIYTHIREKRLPAIKIGRRILVSRRELEKLLNPAENAGCQPVTTAK